VCERVCVRACACVRVRACVPDLQPLYDVPVVLGGGQARVSPGGVLGREPPVEDALLHHVVGLDKQVVHLAVQVHRDGDGPALRWG